MVFFKTEKDLFINDVRMCSFCTVGEGVMLLNTVVQFVYGF